jgi:hypothetical protein
MSNLSRFRPLTARLLALLAAWVLLGTQALTIAHAYDCESGHAGHTHGASHPEVHGDAHAERPEGESAEAPCPTCLFKASASVWGMPPAGLAADLSPGPRSIWPAADRPTRVAVRARAPARGPPGRLLLA